MSDSTEKKRKAGVQFTGTSGGKLDESKIDPEEHTLGDHYLYGEGTDKQDYSYPVVSASGALKRGNVSSAWELGCRGQCPSEDTHRRKLRSLGREFDDNPIPEDQEDAKEALTTPEESGEFTKEVEIVEKDEEERIATGAILLPSRLDFQGDFIRSDTIADLRERFDDRVESGDAYPGVMHSVFPRDDLKLVEDRQLETPEVIGEKELPAGTWLQSWRYTDDRLWSLVKRGVLGGFSIGGTAKGTVYEPGTLPDDVEIPDAVQEELDEADLEREDIPAREITDGRILECSTVDIPAVPDANIADVKSLQKASPALTENVVQARLYLEHRGHDPDAARDLAEYLIDRKAATGESGVSGLVARAKRWLSGGDEQDGDERADTRAGSSDSDFLTDYDMTEDELYERLDALDDRLDEIDAKLSDGEEADEGAEEETKTGDGGEDGGGDDGPTTEEKVNRLAETMIEMSETLDEMASAQGVSQQADQGTAAQANNSEEKIWGENSPFAPPTGGGD